MDPTRGDSRYNLNYNINNIGLNLSENADLSGVGRPSTVGLKQSRLSNNNSVLSGHLNSGSAAGGGGGAEHFHTVAGGQSRGVKRASSECYDDHHRGGQIVLQTKQEFDGCGSSSGHIQNTLNDTTIDDGYNSMQIKKSPPANGKKTKGRVKIKMEYIDNKLRRYTTFSKRKTGIMKKAYELSTLTGTQVMLLVASETGHVYTFATRKLQPMITSEAGKQLIQTCLNSPDPPSGASGGDQRMSATGYEETELSYNIGDEDLKYERSPISSNNESDDSSEIDSPGPTFEPIN